MTIPGVAYVRLTASGRIAGTQSWSTGISVSVTGGTVTQSQLNALLATFVTAFTALWNTGTTLALKAANGSDVDLRSFRAYLYGPSGGTAALQAATDITPIPGTKATNLLPTQTALVATLLSGFPGRSNRGRMYLPWTGGGLDGTHQVTSSDTTAISNAVGAMLTAVNAGVGSGPFGRVVIAGLRGVVDVTSVRVDSEPDIQRRRADKIIASRQVITNV